MVFVVLVLPPIPCQSGRFPRSPQLRCEGSYWLSGNRLLWGSHISRPSLASSSTPFSTQRISLCRANGLGKITSSPNGCDAVMQVFFSKHFSQRGWLNLFKVTWATGCSQEAWLDGVGTTPPDTLQSQPLGSQSFDPKRQVLVALETLPKPRLQNPWECSILRKICFKNL